MSRQKKQHTDQRKLKQVKQENKHTVRVHLVDSGYVLLTALILLAAVAGMLVMQFLGWFDTMVGAVLSVIVAGFAVMCVFDLALLLTSNITVTDGVVHAGKDEQGHPMTFHADNVQRVELRDRIGNTVPETQETYRNVAIAFVMSSGRVNQRVVRRIRRKKLDEIREAIK